MNETWRENGDGSAELEPERGQSKGQLTLQRELWARISRRLAEMPEFGKPSRKKISTI
jgi:hypothetical protein